MTIVHAPPKRHECTPPRKKVETLTPEEAKRHSDAIVIPDMFGNGHEPICWREYPVEDDGFGDPWHRVGTIWRCDECDRFWEVCPPPYANVLVNHWEPVGRLRSWRLRRKHADIGE